MTHGKIVKALSGFYDVLIDDQVYRCKGRGVFRNQKITPLVGDYVEVTLQESKDGEEGQVGTIQVVKDRINQLVRPPIANVDQAIIVTSMVEPDFNPLLLDRFLVLVEDKEIKPLLLFSKKDLLDNETQEIMQNYADIYRRIGYDVLMVSSKVGDLTTTLKPYLKDKVSVIAGQSGVGKSTILNNLDPHLNIETGDISKSLGRGKHTTRHVELFMVGGGFVADTPGFSALEFDELSLEDIRFCFREFLLYEESCKFRGCYHINEPKCAIKKAVQDGEIEEFRYHHYQQFYEEIKNRKPRY
ncbi:ribosome small subunit-dependent GTPase A [Alkalibacillus aidingensis]|uniref:ribosome small subunit-dependent GTPase A n=1 Tax=Alkalibacillus aidingensis TaxID=2747607 RepID=UPI001660BB34|nr:ribosome small subunit-dependent GTPase A [Alkalibacillus aidingensis]